MKPLNDLLNLFVKLNNFILKSNQNFFEIRFLSETIGKTSEKHIDDTRLSIRRDNQKGQIAVRKMAKRTIGNRNGHCNISKRSWSRMFVLLLETVLGL